MVAPKPSPFGGRTLGPARNRHSHSRRSWYQCIPIATLVLLVGLGTLSSIFDVSRNNVIDYASTQIFSPTETSPSASTVENQALDNAIESINASGDGEDVEDEVCLHATSIIDNYASWPDAVYHKDRDGYTNSNYFDELRELRGFASVEEEDAYARANIAEFNKIRASVLTPQLLKAGFQPGRIYPARHFANRYRRLADSIGAKGEDTEYNPRPLTILVFGSSFTIGSNCGESSADDNCAWPQRLIRRFDELFFPETNNTTSLVQWKMYQENAQGSVNIAQKIPSIVESLQTTPPDAILLDNSIIDRGASRPWFEAIVRAFIKVFPGTLLVSIVDGIDDFVDNKDRGQYSPILHDVQDHYGLTVVDIGKMAHLQRHDNSSTYIESSVIEEARRVYREHPASGDDFDEDTTIIDLIWPQPAIMKSGNGAVLTDDDARVGEAYFAQFVPLTRKTKSANYPWSHPSWITHQYVADSVMHGLMNVVKFGSECGDDDDHRDEVLDSSILETSVATKEELDASFICEEPLTRIDAKSPPYVDHVIANITFTEDDTNFPSDDNDLSVAVTCGDWQWITDDRKRSGWQSDEYGSIIRFRVKVSADKLPNLSITYMRSHETFGNARVTFYPVTRRELNETPPPPPAFGCNDVPKFLSDENGAVLVPSMELNGWLPQHSFWDTAVFPSQADWSDINAGPAHELLRVTVLNRMEKSEDGTAVVDDDDTVEYVDVYVINTNTHEMRIKIQVVTSC
jgi:hypothetical protein